MITYSEALALVHGLRTPLAAEWVALDKALGRVVAERVMSPQPSPPFDNSAMDGYAIRAEETALATPDEPAIFTIKDLVAAGQASTFYGDKTAIKIMTGASLPAGYDAVLPVEEAQLLDCDAEQKLYIKTAIQVGRHVRYKGEDILEGDCVLIPGDKITANHIMVCATLGLGRLLVRKQPIICLLSTGQEIVDDYTRPLAPGAIYNSNTPYLQALLQDEYLGSTYLGTFHDDPVVFKQQMHVLLRAEEVPDLIISTGAVSKGDFDFIPAALLELEATIVFHGVAIRPGKPILFATLGKTVYVGLPGNPISAALGYLFLVKPLLKILQGAPLPVPVRAKLVNSFMKKGNFRQFLKARATLNTEATLCVRILEGQESSKVKPLLEANAWVILDEETTFIDAGQNVSLVLVGALHHE